MRTVLLVALLIGGVGCSSAQSKHQSNDFIDAEQAKIKQHALLLVKSGHMTSEFTKRMEVSTLLGEYAWRGDGNGYFGAYSFSKPAFEQSKRGWFLHGEVIEGSNELWPQDDWDSDNQKHEITFDQSAIGMKIPGMSMFWVENGKHKNAWFTATIVGLKDDGHTAVLDRSAPHHAEQWGMEIVPADWQDMCNCTNNFHPPFVDGRPVVEPVTN